jgi:hypothetical protein
MSILLYRITLTVGRLVGLTCLANSNGVVMICCLPRCWCEILDIGAVGHQGGLCGQLFGERRGGVDVCCSLVIGYSEERVSGILVLAAPRQRQLPGVMEA